jgi:hypothetical protein
VSVAPLVIGGGCFRVRSFQNRRNSGVNT